MSSDFRKERRRLLLQERVDIDYAELKAIIAQTEETLLSDEQRATLDAAIDTLAHLEQQVSEGAGIRDIRRFFGWPSEKTRNVVGGGSGSDEADVGDDEQADGGDDEQADDADDADGGGEGMDGGGSERGEKKTRKKRTSGRRAASEYTGATVVTVEHQGLRPKDDCPDVLCDGKVYASVEPAKIIRITGVAPLSATRYDCQRLRCNLCGTIYTAEPEDDIGESKYDESAPAMIGLLRYGYGLPHSRIEKLCGSCGIPMPSSTQWDLVNEAADVLMPVFDELVLQAAQGDVITIDDTHMKVLELNARLDKAYKAVEARVDAGELPKSALDKQRTGVQTTGMVANGPDGDIVLFLTGEKHAGENFEAVLAHRAAELMAPIRMADGLSRNFVGDVDATDANCLVHGRRHFVDVASSFPGEVRYVLDQLALIYKHDDETKRAAMTPEERLAYHQTHSKPIMDDLHAWLRRQIDQRLVEPNSGLGGALAYFDDHWERLTLFLRIAGAPLDSNVVERALKKAIRHRRNSLFYRSIRGAEVGDCFMSLIHTAEGHGVSAFDYLTAVLRYGPLVANSPADWMPWNYRATMDRLRLS